jgi:hypothetical protein
MRSSVLVVLVGVAACASETGPSLPSLFLQETGVPADIAVGAVAVTDSTGVATVWLTFTDTATHPDTITYGVCSFAALLYPEGSSRAAWQSVSTEPHPCPALAVLLAIPSGGTRAALAGRLAGAVAAGSEEPLVPAPPVGRFTAAAVLNDGTRYRIIPAGAVTCTAAGCAN